MTATHPTMTAVPYGEGAYLVEFAEPQKIMGWCAALVARRHPAVDELVPGATTVLVTLRADASAAIRRDLAAILTTIEAMEQHDRTASLVEIVVRYDGADLARVAELSHVSVDEVIALHTSVTYESAFCGFAPGFTYLSGLDPRLVCPRLATPRPKVARGSVAVASSYCGVYPADMPGGWNVIGHTDVSMWDLLRTSPALCPPGTRVRFVAAGATTVR